jgi:hypothetical protein
MTNTYCVYTVLRYSWWWTVDLSETCRVLYQINLRNSASRCLLLQEYTTMHGPLNTYTHIYIYIRGSFQKFCTLYVFSLKIDLFYKVHLQAYNVISIVLYHSGPTFGQVLYYSRLDAFVVDASDYSGHLIRHPLNASEAFPMKWFLQFW